MLCKIKEGKRQVWLDWSKRLHEHKEEALVTLQEEDLIRESCLVFNDDYVVYIHETEGDKVKKPFNPDRGLNRLHDAKFKECLEIVARVKDEGYDFRV